jgi:hypothetical protein
MRWWKRTRGFPGAAVLIIAVVLAPLATASSAAADVVASSSTLAPKLLSSGRTAFYSATWTNGGRSTLTQVVAVITLPPGSALAAATPPVCTATSASDSVVVSCPRDNLAAGAAVTQQLLVTMSAAADVKAVLTAKESTNDENKSHQDTFPAPDQPVTIVDATSDAAGGCIKNGDQALATRDGLSAANPLITTATLAGPTGVPPCVPVTVQERAPTSAADACGEGATCTTDIAVSDFFSVFAQLPSSPVQLTFTVLGSNKNLTWYKTDSQGTRPVADCPGATNLPQGVSACVTSRSKSGSTGVRLGVLWRAGPDPSWRG